MHASSRFKIRTPFIALLIASGAIVPLLSGCHQSPSGDVVATVNGKEVARADLERMYQGRLAENPQSPSPQEANILRMDVLRGMIQDEVLQQQAAKLNLTATDEDVNAKLTEIKAPFTEDQFANQLKQRNLTLDDLKRDIRRQLTTNKLFNKEIESKINITDAQIATYYNAHKAEFNYIEPQYHLAQIAVSVGSTQQGPNLSARTGGEAEAKKKIQALYSRLEAGQDFASVATQYSEDSNTASMGGDMGIVAESSVKSDAEIYDALNKLKPKQFTEPLPVFMPNGSHQLAGYAIYELIAREPAGQRDLNDPRTQQFIHTTLHDSEQQLLRTAYLEMLMDQAKVRNYFAEQIYRQNGQ